MKFKPSFRYRLSVIYFVSTSVPLLLVVFLFSIYFRDIYIRDVNATASNSLYSVASHIESYLGELSSLTMTPYTNVETMAYIRVLVGLETAENGMTAYLKQRNYNRTMQQMIYLYRSGVCAVVFVPWSDAPQVSPYLVTANIPETQRYLDDNVKSSRWFLDTVQEKGKAKYLKIDSLGYTPSSGNIIFSVSRLIVDLDTHAYLGVIRVDAQNENIRNILQKMNVSASSKLVLTDSYDQVIYADPSLSTEIGPDLSDLPTSIQANDDVYGVQCAFIGETGWKLYYLSSQKEINSATAFFYLSAAVIGLSFMAVTLVIYTSGSRSMVRSIQSILQVMKRVESGDLAVRVKEERTDEIGAISSALNQMIGKLSKHIESEYVAVIRSKEVEYYALQSQINPHFLYNILNSISTLNRLGDKKTVDETLTQLVNFLRHTSTHKSVTTVEQEFSFLREYLLLQKLRFEDRLDFAFDLQEGARDLELPNFLLQPLIENSIIHGMEPYDIPVFIEISASLSTGGDKLRLSVKDNGKGFDVNALDTTKSIGLGNIVSRLSILNEKSVFHIESSPETGTSILIEIPLKPSECIGLTE